MSLLKSGLGAAVERLVILCQKASPGELQLTSRYLPFLNLTYIRNKKSDPPLAVQWPNTIHNRVTAHRAPHHRISSSSRRHIPQSLVIQLLHKHHMVPDLAGPLVPLRKRTLPVVGMGALGLRPLALVDAWANRAA